MLSKETPVASFLSFRNEEEKIAIEEAYPDSNRTTTLGAVYTAWASSWKPAQRGWAPSRADETPKALDLEYLINIIASLYCLESAADKAAATDSKKVAAYKLRVQGAFMGIAKALREQEPDTKVALWALWRPTLFGKPGDSKDATEASFAGS
ncbi:hypothetical protein BC828DRAFT_416108 [Blastocladiella britannica]|nr:hypothetical protein BC828DRAFT_416108 [Blastocladiella britannica]